MVFPILMALAQLAPAIIPLFDSDNESTANKAAKAVSDVAKAVTGTDSESAALEALKADPAMLIEYQRGVTERATALYQAETDRLKSVNETIRTEVASSDVYVRRMRPTMGYALILSWSALMFGIVYTIIVNPVESVQVVTAVSSLGLMWSVALSVLGLYVYKRSEDKKPDAGSMGVLSAVAKRIAGR